MQQCNRTCKHIDIHWHTLTYIDIHWHTRLYIHSRCNCTDLMKLLKIRHLFGVKHTCHIVSYVWQAKGNHMTTASARGYRKKAVRCMPQDPQASEIWACYIPSYWWWLMRPKWTGPLFPGSPSLHLATVPNGVLLVYDLIVVVADGNNMEYHEMTWNDSMMLVLQWRSWYVVNVVLV